MHRLPEHWLRYGIALLASGLVAGAPALAQDIPGGKDHPALKRFAGSQLIGYEVRNFDTVEFQTSTFVQYDLKARARQYAQPGLTQEGRLTRLWYEAPGATRAIELYRNYENELTSTGFKPLYDSTQDKAAGRWNGFLNPFSTIGRDAIKNNRSGFVFSAAKMPSLQTGTFQKDGTTVRLVAVDWAAPQPTYKAVQGAYIAVDILEAQAMKQDMVVINAADIASALASTGKVAIYGILFDTGKADIKPESRPSLEQIATFLQRNTAARLHVVGHTDSVGAFDSNLALSRRRADAVVAALGAAHGISAARLQGNGVGSLAPVASNGNEDGRAKNRRVELVLQ